jgi:hypothetical protein
MKSKSTALWPLAFFVLTTSLLLSGCSRRPLEIIPHKTMVINFDTSTSYEPGFTLHGWWFSSRDHRRNENAGKIFADVLARKLRDLPEVELYPRINLRYYLDAKEKQLASLYPELNEETLSGLMNQVDPVTFARDRECSILILGTIYDSYLVHNRTIHWWQSYVDGEIRVIDASTGDEIWNYPFHERDNFKSQLGLYEKIARRVVKKIKKKKVLR